MFDEGQQATGGTATPSLDGERLVIDSPLLFSGSFGREGQDLVITGEGTPVRVPGYFADQAPQALYSPQGAMLRGETVELLAGPQAPGQYAQADQSLAGVLAGKVGQLTGSATVQHSDGTTEPLAVDKQVFQGDVLQTGADGTLGVLFQDNTVLQLQPSSRVVINEFVYDPASTSNSATLDAVDGTFAFVAGKVAKTGGLDVTTPIATMGIRGTTGLCVALDAAAARCALAPDPNFEVGRIGIFDNATGAQFTTLTQIDVKLVLQQGALAVVDKTNQEIVFDELLVQQLHQLYADLGVPQSGLQKINYDTGSPDFSVPVPHFGNGDVGALPLLIDSDLHLEENRRDDIVNQSLPRPIGGSATVGNLDETGLGSGPEQLTGVLPVSFNGNGVVTFNFASLNGSLVRDSNGSVATAGGVALRFVWNAATNTLSGMAGAETVFSLVLDPNTGRYSAVLLAAIDHTGAGSDLLFIPLTFTAQVDDGRSGQGTLTIVFADDVPHMSVTSAQVSEAQQVTGTWSLDAGADGVASLLVKIGGASKTLSLADPAGHVAFQLAQGTLVVKADGTWTFTAAINLNNNVTQAVTFSLTATDGDGDPVTAVSTITITDGAAPTAVANELTLQLDERALDAGDVRPGDDIGSQPGLDTDHASGSLSFTAGSDRLVDFVLDASKIVVLNELGQPMAVSWVGTGTGQLTGFVSGVAAIRITVGDATIQAFSTGNVLVTAQLLDNFHHAADGADAIQIGGIAVVARDIDGSAVTSGGFKVTIADDSASIALGELPASVEEGKTVSGEYNLVPGADGVSAISVSVTFQNQEKALDLSNPNNSVIFDTPEGVLKVFANGTWSFTAANNLDNEGSSIQFTLTARDGDDDTNAVTAVQAIEVIDGTIAPQGQNFPTVSLQEDGTVGGSSTSSFTAGSDDLVAFRFDLSALPTITGIAGGVDWQLGATPGELIGRIDGQPVIRLTVTAGTIDALSSGNVAVTAELLGALPHAAPGTDLLTISGIRVVAAEADGDSATALISVAITDDVPVAGADGNNVGEGAVIAGNVLTDDVFGADGKAAGGGVVGVAAGDDVATPVSGGTGVGIQGQFGTLTLNADGSYSYDALPDIVPPAGATDVFVYTIEDGDGDRSTTTLTIKLTDGGLGTTDIERTVEESALEGGSNPASGAETVSGSLAAAGGTAPYTFELIGSATTAHGVLTLDAQGNYSYTLTAPVEGPNADDGATTAGNVDSFQYRVTDANGNTTLGTISIDVTDDVPAAVDEPARFVAEDASAIGGNLLSNDTAGADGATLADVKLPGSSEFVPIGGSPFIVAGLGTYTFASDGSWTFDPVNDRANPADATFSYRITDGDGDTDEATQQITVNDGAPPQGGATASATLDEANLGGGSDPNAAELTQQVTLSFTAGSDTLDQFRFSTDLSGLTKDGDTATAAGAIDWQRVSDTEIVGRVDGLTVIRLTLTPPDPIAPTTSGEATVTVVLSGAFANTFGDDVATNLNLGSIRVEASDGDTTVTGTVSLAMADDTPSAFANAPIVLDEDGLIGGNPGGSGDADPTTSGPTAVTGVLALAYGADGAGTTRLTGVSLPAALGFSVTTNTGTDIVISQLQAGVLVSVLAIHLTDAASGAYTVTQLHPIDHPVAGTEDNVQFTVDYAVTDADGDVSNGSVGVSVNDDTPTLGAFDSGTIANEVGTLTGTFELSTGADGIDHFNVTGPVVDGVSYLSATTFDDTGLATTTLTARFDPDGAGGNAPVTLYTLAVHADGTYTFDLITPEVTTTNTVDFGTLSAGNATFTETADGRVEFTSDGSINTNENSFGVQNSFIDGGESFQIEFHNPATAPGTPVDDAASVDQQLVDAVRMNIARVDGSGVVLHWTATDTVSGAIESGTISVTEAGSILIDPSIEFNRIEFSATADAQGQNRIQISSIAYDVDILPNDQHLDFGISAVDGDGDTTSTGSLGIDITTDTAGTFTLAGTSGDDVLAASTHVDILSGGSGNDLVDYSDSLAAVSVNLDDNGAASGSPADLQNPGNGTVGGGDAQGVSLGIEGVRGGAGNDYIAGNSASNQLYGGAGNDTLVGEGGNDLLYGGAGHNTLSGGAGGDTFVIDAAALAQMGVFDVIADYESGVDMIDLSGIFTSIGVSASNEVAAALSVTFSDGAAHLAVDTNGSTPGGLQEVASLANTGPGAVISIIYDHNQPAHDVQT